VTRQKTRPPISALAMLQQEVNELFQRLSILDRSDRLPGSEWSPAVDVLEQRDRLLVIAGKCPVHKVLARETPVTVSDRVETL